jgi:hypothetical protein
MYMSLEGLESIFSTFENQRHRERALDYLGDHISRGIKSPDFVSDLSVPDFITLSERCCSALRKLHKDQYNRYEYFYNMLCDWLSKDPRLF